MPDDPNGWPIATAIRTGPGESVMAIIAPLLAQAEESTIASLEASRFEAARELNPSLFRMLRTSLATVRSDMNRRAPICLLLRPWATSLPFSAARWITTSEALCVLLHHERFVDERGQQVQTLGRPQVIAPVDGGSQRLMTR